jgi:uncharacterized protein YbjT (DUF2867 family)
MSSTDGPIAITGARGFVASRLIPRLEAARRPIVAILRPGRDRTLLAARGIPVRHADLDRSDGLEAAFEGVRTVVHLSGMAQATWLTPALERARVRRAIFVSSAGVHTQLASASADAKRGAETTVRASGLVWTILRPTMIYGAPGDRNLERLLSWVRGCPLLLVPSGGSALQQPVHVDDLVSAILAALERPETAGQAYDLGGAEALPFAELVQLCGELLGRPTWMLPVPAAPVHGLLNALRRLRLPVPLRPEQILRLGENKAVNIGPAMRDLDFLPRGIEAGLRREIEMLFPSGAGKTQTAATPQLGGS